MRKYTVYDAFTVEFRKGNGGETLLREDDRVNMSTVGSFHVYAKYANIFFKASGPCIQGLIEIVILTLNPMGSDLGWRLWNTRVRKRQKQIFIIE